ncbi:glutathionylspermidine synthase family protein, partial [Escherichia coli]|uniref:glutathionylspermidine synthase family protein n=1 Tax=Escherichia coli TaxID=562 RepID=UPI00193123A4|nr:glutathionylspermidine synthase family protein [Escherichia coli]
LRDTAQAAGLATDAIRMEDIGWSHAARRLVDLRDREIENCFHLYPGEWLLAEDFGPELLESLGSTRWIEPIWKSIWSNTA